MKILKLDRVGIDNAEILDQGTFKGIKIDDAFMDEMIRNFEADVYPPVVNPNDDGRPGVTINHNKKQTRAMQEALKSRNLGIVSSLKKVGKKLVATFKDVPLKLAELIESGTMRFRSVEFLTKYTDAQDKSYNNVLTGVTFHGGADGSSAVTSLSDDLQLVFKDVDNADDDNLVSIEYTTGGHNIMEMTILKSEYNDLKKSEGILKDVEVELNTFKNENVSLKAENEKLSKEVEEFKSFKKEVEENKVVLLKKEANEYIDGLIADKKLMPKFKDFEVDNYISFSSDEEKLTLYKEKMESVNEVANLEETKVKTDSTENVDLKNMSSDEINEIVEAKMKAEGISFVEAYDKVTK
jgi:hypothetical protein